MGKETVFTGRAVDKHMIVEDHIEIDQSLLIDTNFLTVSSLISSREHSVIYKGRFKGAPAALKIIKPMNALNVSPDHNDKILREIMMLSRVKHENIEKFIGATVHATFAIVMEFMKSGSLQKYLFRIKPNGGLDLKLCRNFALDISRAMECLHRNGIIHRNLKPSNIHFC
ncbi:serine/threonine/tyrosine-protein kinase HT1-like [Macadamia integrifolia]|uniref:serine/threonine/tyrosine-protein kinase HT1-like n=1 Tax=Macadamia integrifolia TaxID=60698 RepID=UPI001C4F81CB|nr:serine/threonine/tyrosine-protein kinase HT1-like [Macadamia integrifolia]